MAVPTNDQPLIRVRQSTHVTISGCQPVDPIPSFLVVEGDLTRDIKLAGNDLSRVREVVKFRDGGKASAVKLMNNFQ